MGYRLTLLASIVLVFAGSLLAQKRLDMRARPEAAPRWQCRRIVSMAPSITETLFALGLGDRVVGVTRDSSYPSEVENIKKTGNVGGYYDPNLEAILSLKPDLVVMLEEQAQALPEFEKLHLETLVVSHQTVEGIIASFAAIGRRCGKGPEGRRMACDFRRRVDLIRKRARELPRPRVLFVLDRTFGCGHLADLYVAADDHYIDTIINWAGGENACQQRGVRYPVISTEGVLRLNPDVIIDMAPPDMVKQYGRKKILDDWKDLREVEAVKNHRIYILDQDYAYIPGPRFLQLVETLARLLHPEMSWDDLDNFCPPDDADSRASQRFIVGGDSSRRLPRQTGQKSATGVASYNACSDADAL